MKVLICGSRHFNDYIHLTRVLSGIEITELVEGGARGADYLGRRFAEERGIPVRTFPADWNQYGRAAGPIRNHQMLREGNPDRVVAFWDEKSPGTKHMIEIARNAGVPTLIECLSEPQK